MIIYLIFYMIFRGSAKQQLWQKAALSAENEDFFAMWGHKNYNMTALDRNFYLKTKAVNPSPTDCRTLDTL